MEIGFLLSLLGILILLILGAFFSAAETSLTGASKARLHAREKEGSKRAAMVNKIRKKKDQMIGAMLLGNNFVNTLGAAVATGVLIKMFGEVGIFYATAIMTILILIFAEVLPKTYAVHHAEKFAVRYAYLINFFIRLFYPITQTVAWIVRLSLKAFFHIDITKVTSGSKHELLRGVIDMHRGSGDEYGSQRTMLRSILDLFEVTVEDIMVHRQNVFMVDGDLPVREIVNEVLLSSYSRLPVWKDRQDNIVGVIQVRLLLKAISDAGGIENININEAMLEPWFIPETTSLHDQLQAFRERKEHFATVVDEYGTFMGIVTLEDILEEIVGEIDDEVDESVAGVKRGKGGSYLVDGSVTIRDLNREFEWRLPDDHYSTVAGLILYESETIPDIGQKFNFHGLKFEVMNRERHKLTRVRITPPKKIKKLAA
jgi:Mg2+/Co2+ transporter CorB